VIGLLLKQSFIEKEECETLKIPEWSANLN